VSTIREIRLQRLQVLLDEHKGVKKDLAKTLGKAPAQISQWIGGARTITEDSARSIEKAAKKPPGWLDFMEDQWNSAPKSTFNHLIEAHTNGLLLDETTVLPFTQPPRLEWEHLLTDAELPRVFCLAMPDDSMEPFTPRGTALVLTSGTQPVPGHGVLVCNARGEHFIRMYQQGPAGRWIAQPRNPAYAALDSERDELRILATVTGRMSGLM
jgi:plasmid maintenance system antidote protein VapI